jgi:hypothetical protein
MMFIDEQMFAARGEKAEMSFASATKEIRRNLCGLHISRKDPTYMEFTCVPHVFFKNAKHDCDAIKAPSTIQ